MDRLGTTRLRPCFDHKMADPTRAPRQGPGDSGVPILFAGLPEALSQLQIAHALAVLVLAGRGTEVHRTYVVPHSIRPVATKQLARCAYMVGTTRDASGRPARGAPSAIPTTRTSATGGSAAACPARNTVSARIGRPGWGATRATSAARAVQPQVVRGGHKAVIRRWRAAPHAARTRSPTRFRGQAGFGHRTRRQRRSHWTGPVRPGRSGTVRQSALGMRPLEVPHGGHRAADDDRGRLPDDDGDRQRDILRYQPPRHESTAWTAACSCLFCRLDTIQKLDEIRLAPEPFPRCNLDADTAFGTPCLRIFVDRGLTGAPWVILEAHRGLK